VAKKKKIRIGLKKGDKIIFPLRLIRVNPNWTLVEDQDIEGTGKSSVGELGWGARPISSRTRPIPCQSLSSLIKVVLTYLGSFGVY